MRGGSSRGWTADPRSPRRPAVDLLYSASEDDVVMIEAKASEWSEDDFIAALKGANSRMAPLLNAQRRLWQSEFSRTRTGSRSAERAAAPPSGLLLLDDSEAAAVADAEGHARLEHARPIIPKPPR